MAPGTQLALKKFATPARTRHFVQLQVCTHSTYACAWLLYSTSPTLRHVAAHRRHVTLVDEVSDGHVPAGCPAFTRVTALFPFQVVDVDAWIGFLHHGNSIVGCSST